MKAIAYTDGSYRENKYSYGYVLILETGEAIGYGDCGDDATWGSMNNIAGELLAVFAVLRLVGELGISELLVMHDYTGIGEWANGTWKCKKEATQYYKDTIGRYRSMGLVVNFKWIRGHKGDEFNTLADKIASNAYYGETTMKIPDIPTEKFDKLWNSFKA